MTAGHVAELALAVWMLVCATFALILAVCVWRDFRHLRTLEKRRLEDERFANTQPVAIVEAAEALLKEQP